jgi:hypothetical protein
MDDAGESWGCHGHGMRIIGVHCPKPKIHALILHFHPPLPAVPDNDDGQAISSGLYDFSHEHFDPHNDMCHWTQFLAAFFLHLKNKTNEISI